MYQFDKTPGRVAYIKEQEYLFFSGYNYLGMHQVKAFEALVQKGIEKYGWLFPSSRISNTTIGIFEEAENLLCNITGAEATIMVASGYVAGRIATAHFRDNLINLTPSHPAITRQHTNQAANVFAVDSLDPLTAAITDFSFIDKGSAPKTLIIDDSHGIGLLGAAGEGISGILPRHEHTTCLLTYSLSKAFHIIAGAISCNTAMAVQYRKDHAYTSATAPSPALLHAFVHGQDLYKLQREKLRYNMAYFSSLIRADSGIRHHPEFPVYILPADIDEQKLAAAHIIISSFAYPDINSKKINRVVLNALHTKDDLEKLAACLYKSDVL